ncbi:guanine nucleotide-binding protein-like 1 [Dinothrombium tinctorium]|uniref:Guanine nucleotide-binding protein-like 1 n=1 Tax=Dinothrombium tinctorium TaxID=1965070 RepID=A0A3S3P4T7_9ACAR|nr:guanine nucleotide-binding protein-like 1 [Dinothrombium tinctorium]
MPRGRHKLPFSGKQKKAQLLQKRDRQKQRKLRAEDEDDGEDERDALVVNTFTPSLQLLDASGDSLAINAQKSGSSSRDRNRYALLFRRETDEQLKRRKEEAKNELPPVDSHKLEVQSEDIFVLQQFALPKRPPWNPSMSKAELEMHEQRYFREYVDMIEREYRSLGDLGYFELNLETWRQLWRVLEMSDIVLVIADIRHPICHFPPGLYEYVVQELKKDIILVLNKVDLVCAPLVLAWIDYLKKKFPRLYITPFASYAGMKMKKSGKNKGRRIGKLRMASKSAEGLLAICEEIVGDKVDLSSWRKKIEEELREEEEDEDSTDSDDEEFHPLKTGTQKLEKVDLSYYEGQRFKDGVLTIGCVGHPNVGKSSLLNAVMGKKVVSVSRTPGHTKHFQTIFLTKTVKLCDCPGLVFPSIAPRPLQVLMGCFPIAQLREPYSVIAFIAERIDLPKILNLKHPANEDKWSAYDICEAWALKRGYLTAKTGRPDVYRAANHMLRMALDGRTICLAFFPPNYLKDFSSKWSNSEDLKKIEYLQCQSTFDSDQYFDSFDQDMVENREKRCSSDDEADGDDADDADEEDTSESDSEFGATSNKFALLKLLPS